MTFGHFLISRRYSIQAESGEGDKATCAILLDHRLVLPVHNLEFSRARTCRLASRLVVLTVPDLVSAERLFTYHASSLKTMRVALIGSPEDWRGIENL